MPYVQGAGGQIVNEPAQGGGLFGALFDPNVQAQRQAVQQNQIKLGQETAFQNGVPTDANGNPDYSAMANTLLQKGAYGDANSFLQTGISQQFLKQSQQPSGVFGGGGPASGSGQGGQSGVPASSGMQSGAANPDVVNFIKSYSASKGINPNVALAVASSEGLNGFDPNGNANLGDQGSSGGPFQLHYGGVAPGGNAVAGLGDDFTKATRLDARDPSTWKQQIMFAIDHAAQNGWGAWHGAKAAGIGNWDGIGNPTNQPSASAANNNPPSPQSPAAQPPPASAQPTAAGAPIGDQAVTDARNRLAAAQDLDPSSLTRAQQQQLTADTGTVATYQAQQATPQMTATAGTDDGTGGARPLTIHGPGNVQTAQNGASDAPSTVHPFGAAPASQPATASVPPPQMTAYAPSPPANAGPVGPVGGGAPPQPGPGAPSAPPQPIAQNGPPPQVVAAVTRLRSGQGSQADSTLVGSYLQSQGQSGGGLPQAGAAPLPQPAAPAPASFANGGNAAPGLLDPTLGGLVSPQQLARYGSAGGVAQAAFQEAANGANNPYLKGRVEQLKTYASGIMSALEKANVPTPEEKNARDPDAQAYEQRRATFNAQARVDAQNSQSAITGAGLKTKASVDAAASDELVPSVQPDGSTIMVTKSQALANANAGNPVTSAQPGYITQGQAALQTKLSTGSAAYQERQSANQRLDAMSKLLETYETGTNSTAFSNAVANLQSYGIKVPTTAMANPAAMQQFAKDGYANVLSSMKEQGNKQYAAEVQSAVNSNPNPELQPEANAAMIAQMQGIKKYTDQNFRDYSKWYHQNKGAADDADFQTGWADKNDLGSYISDARKEIAPRGIVPPAPADRPVGQKYMIPGRGVFRWNGSGWTAP